MKQLPLKDVMRHFAVTINKDGYEVSNPAGTAQYDHHGVRTTVNGIPEYFPITLAVKDKSRLAAGGLIGAADLTVKPKPAECVSTVKISIDIDTNTLTALENQLTRIAELSERIQKTQYLGEPAEYVGQSTYTISVGQVFIADAQIKDGIIQQAELTKERQGYLKREVQAIIERELQAGGRLWQVTRGR